jgi:hypothetical protein
MIGRCIRGTVVLLLLMWWTTLLCPAAAVTTTADISETTENTDADQKADRAYVGRAAIAGQSTCSKALLAACSGLGSVAECDVCVAHHQHRLRVRRCTAAAVAAFCKGLPVDAKSILVQDGYLIPGGQFIGHHTSQLQVLIDGSFSAVSKVDWHDRTVVNSTNLRSLKLAGEYMADVPLALPSLFTLQLEGTLRPAANLSKLTSRFTAMVEMRKSTFSAVLGGTYDASTLPVHNKSITHGYMAISIIGGSRNAIRSVRAIANNSDSILGVNQSPHAEIANCEVGGSSVLGMMQTRCIWSLATSRALVHDNHVHHCSTSFCELRIWLRWHGVITD